MQVSKWKPTFILPHSNRTKIELLCLKIFASKYLPEKSIHEEGKDVEKSVVYILWEETRKAPSGRLQY